MRMVADAHLCCVPYKETFHIFIHTTMQLAPSFNIAQAAPGARSQAQKINPNSRSRPSRQSKGLLEKQADEMFKSLCKCAFRLFPRLLSACSGLLSVCSSGTRT
jgi:hypothetical protein